MLEIKRSTVLGSTKMSNVLILGSIEAEISKKMKWPMYCGTPCNVLILLPNPFLLWANWIGDTMVPSLNYVNSTSGGKLVRMCQGYDGQHQSCDGGAGAKK